MTADSSVLVVVDIQGKLANMMHEASRVQIAACKTIDVAKIFNIPILWTEQVPDKIGATIDVVASHLTPARPIIKHTFSCYGQPEFVQQLSALNRRDIILIGIESHVCVYQTFRDMNRHGYRVQLVADAVSSRTAFHYETSLKRMQQEGAVITTTEMLFCELLVTANDARFKKVMEVFKR